VSAEPFIHADAQRTIVFGAGALERAAGAIGEGYVLLTTPRALAALGDVSGDVDGSGGEAPSSKGAASRRWLPERAVRVVNVPLGAVPEAAARIRSQVRGDRLVALGGGRVIDAAKALAAADGPRVLAAIPTSLSGAEMTGVHRHAHGVPASAPRERATLVVNDPALSASQPLDALAASSANALGHATTALLSDRATPLSKAVAGEAIERFVDGWADEQPDRPALALGALLAGWAVDHSGLGPHHALAQSAVRAASLGHAAANAALLPATLAAARVRKPAELERLDTRTGRPLQELAERLRERSNADLGALLADERLLEGAVEAAMLRAELDRIPPRPDEREVRAIYREGRPNAT
jgi:maleylacetate reductase